MAKLYNLARMTTSTTGTGTITLGSAVASYVTFAAAGAQNGETVTYAIVDGNNREVGRGVYTSSGTTLTRATILESTNSNLAINLSGNAEVFITAAAEDIANVNETNTFTTNQIISVTDNTNAALRVTQLGTAPAIRVEDSTNPDASPFVVNADGTVAIGNTTTGSSKLLVYDANASITTNEVAAAGSGVASSRWKYSTNHYGAYVGPTNALIFYDYGTANAERLRIDSSGNVGIGTTSPGVRLDVSNSSAAVARFTGPNNGYVDVTDGTTTLRSQIIASVPHIGSPTSTALNLTTNNTTRFTIGALGQWGIGGANYGTSTQYMKSGGSGAAPSWATIASTDVSGLGTLATQSGTFSGTSSGTNTGDQNLFSTIAVSGQSSVVADTTSDTLTLVAGTNVTITTDASTDTVTIAASGGSGSTMEYIAHGVQSGTSAVSFTSIPSGYTTLYLYCQFHYAAGGRHRVALSSNNGSSYGTVRNITSAVGASGVAGGWVAISNVSASGSSKVITPSVSEVDRLDNTTNRAADIYTTTATETVITGLINALQVTCDAGNNTSTITLYGVR